MACKRMKIETVEESDETILEQQALSSDINDLIQASPRSMTNNSYHESVCGSILCPQATKDTSEIFSFIQHSQFDSFRRSVEYYHSDIVKMRNNINQTVLHALVMNNNPFVWVRLMIIRLSDPCAQDNDGCTPAHYATEKDDVEMLKALTVRFQAPAKPITEEQVQKVHENCLKALTVRNKNGLTPFMVACQRESIKCLNYLIELNVNDSNLQDNFGETCLHYAVARRNMSLVEKLVKEFNANVNGGDETRPSVLDVIQFIRQQQKQTEQKSEEDIERFLLQNKACNRRTIRRQVGKRKAPGESEETVVNNMASLSLDLMTNGSTETARSHARLANSLHRSGDIDGALTNFRIAMNYISEDSINWANYACEIGKLLQTRGQHEEALEILTKALNTRVNLEVSSDEIDELRSLISSSNNKSN